MPDALLSDERRILTVLDEGGGLTTRDVAGSAGFRMSSNPRSNSARFRDRLIRMRIKGLVDILDGQKPVCWVRTKRGSKALAAASGEGADA